MKKEYDYWLIVWETKEGEEIRHPANFQKGIASGPYWDEVMQCNPGEYEGYWIFR